MNVIVNAVGFTADNSLINFIEKKLNKLDTFYDRIIDSHVFLRLDKGQNSKIATKFVEIKVNVPGSHLFVKEKGDSFEEATDLSLNALTRLVKRYKQKADAISREKMTLETDINE